MTATSERRTIGSTTSAGGQTQDLFHIFPYHFVAGASSRKAHVLEVGFGEGYGADVLARSAAQYVGLEVSTAAVDHARLHHASDNVRFELYDGVTIPFAESSFDRVISFHVIEHLHDPRAFVAELRRVCRGGGSTVIVTPNAAFRLSPGQRPWSRFHVREFRHGELAQLMSEHFARFSVMGIAGSAAMNELERARVTRARRLARLDPLGMRFLLPEALLLPVRRLLMARRAPAASDELPVSLEDVHCVKEDVDAAPHLLAVGYA